MSERILVVEDNESLRVGVIEALGDVGYAVLPASSGAEALQVPVEGRISAYQKSVCIRGGSVVA